MTSLEPNYIPWIIAVVVVAAIVWAIKTHSGNVKKRQKAKAQEAQKAEELRAEFDDLHQAIMKVLADGKLPDINWERDGRLPFKLMKSEHLIYVFSKVRYLEQRTKREVVGRSAGVSIRVAKGVSFRTGASKGTPVEKDEVVDRGVGLMAITTKHLYFSGERSFRIPFGKMVSVESLADGVVVTRDRASAQPEIFIVGTLYSPLAYDLLQAVPSLDMGHNPERDDASLYLNTGLADADHYTVEESGEDNN